MPPIIYSAIICRMKFALFVFLSVCLLKVDISPKRSVIGTGNMPTIARDGKGILHLVYGSGDSLLYVRSNNNGGSFSKPQLVDIIPGLAVNATRGPQVTVTKNGVSVLAATDAGNIWSFTKSQQGNWPKGKRVNDVDSVNLEGFVDVASNGGSDLFAVWLDLRGNKRNKLYGARSSDGGKTWSANIKVYESPDSTICECCRVSVAMNAQKVYVMFRNQLYGHRDLHLVSSINGGKTFGKPTKLGEGTWELKGCPMDGGGLTLNSAGQVETVWRREAKIYYCEPGEREVAIGEGKGCTIENVNGKNVFAWVKNGEVIYRLPDGSLNSLGKGSSPVLQEVADGHVLCAWENDNQIYSTVIDL